MLDVANQCSAERRPQDSYNGCISFFSSSKYAPSDYASASGDLGRGRKALHCGSETIMQSRELCLVWAPGFLGSNAELMT